ncbi:hypothetical protein PLESTB_000229300 [Pleodorina starrii]|uniref:Uncharacterized protein n=1 Tax=Pleodorina starrii TaxID=330485 RepID=A0A9W6EYX4_9CHLO|nr:hypothetical protein PLESTB_000229300 [Pleodorina starrii]
MRQAIPVEQQVALALFHLAHGGSYRVLENQYAVARRTASKVVRRFAEGVLEVFANECGYPNAQRKTEIMEEFAVDSMPGRACRAV